MPALTTKRKSSDISAFSATESFVGPDHFGGNQQRDPEAASMSTVAISSMLNFLSFLFFLLLFSVWFCYFRRTEDHFRGIPSNAKVAQGCNPVSAFTSVSKHL